MFLCLLWLQHMHNTVLVVQRLLRKGVLITRIALSLQLGVAARMACIASRGFESYSLHLMLPARLLSVWLVTTGSSYEHPDSFLCCVWQALLDYERAYGPEHNQGELPFSPAPAATPDVSSQVHLFLSHLEIAECPLCTFSLAMPIHTLHCLNPCCDCSATVERFIVTPDRPTPTALRLFASFHYDRNQ